MKGGVAVMLRLLERLRATPRPVSYVFYDREEGPNHLNGIHAVLADRRLLEDAHRSRSCSSRPATPCTPARSGR